MTDPLFDPWCSNEEIESNGKTFRLLQARPAAQEGAVKLLHGLVPEHYCNPALVRKWLAKWGYKKTLSLVKKDLPEGKKARSGDIGEILATEYVNRKLDFDVPIFRLRYRDHRELALRGDDILAIKIDDQNRIHFLKGEAKSRKALSADVVDEASTALDAHDGRPSPHTLSFVVKRLSDLGEDGLYEALETYLCTPSIPRKRVTHLMFVLSGNDPKKHLESHLSTYSGKIQRVVIGLRVKDHPEFIKAVFDGVKLA